MKGDWKIAGKRDGSAPKVGAVYDVRHSRKGRFTLRVSAVNGEWLRGVILAGVAEAMMSYNVAAKGEEITIRDAHSYLVPRAPSPGGDPEKETMP